MSNPSRTLSVLPKLALVSVLLLATGCQTHTTATTGSLVCTVWLPITYSSGKDTPETALQVRQNNAKRDAYCGK